MIATGTDVKPIECLIFMRDVRSKNYFEQMKGRGTRTLGKDDLQKVTPSASKNKDHFIIVDAVGAAKSKKTDTRTLERKPSVSMKELMMSVAMGAKDEDTPTSLANRVIRLNSQLTAKERTDFAATVGISAGGLAQQLLDAFDEDIVMAKTKTRQIRRLYARRDADRRGDHRHPDRGVHPADQLRPRKSPPRRGRSELARRHRAGNGFLPDGIR